MFDIRCEIDSIYEELVALRRDIHQHPELSFEEYRTSALIVDKLREYGLDSVETVFNTGVVGLVRGTKSNSDRCVAFRSDIDALPIQESTGYAFASENQGVMHACAHDSHAAMLLCAAKILAKYKHEFSGWVKFIFQPGEEKIPGGAKGMLASGVMENPRVDAIIACHMTPTPVENDAGKLAIYEGGATSGFDIFLIDIIGQAGHGSTPHTAHDAILAASQFIVLHQQIVARRINPLRTAVVSVGMLSAGSAQNIIAGNAHMELVGRSYDEESREIIKREIFDIAKGVECISGCKFEIGCIEGYRTVYNDPTLARQLMTAINSSLGDGSCIQLDEPLPYSEDFGNYGASSGVPSAFFALYGGFDGNVFQPLHSSGMSFKEEAMKSGVAAFVISAINILG